MNTEDFRDWRDKIDQELIPRSNYRLITMRERLLLHQRRKNGEIKPDDISFGDWTGPLTLSERHRNACLAIAGGFRSRKIAELFELTESRLSIIISASNARLLIGQFRTGLTDDQLFLRILRLGFDPDDRWWKFK